MDLELVRNQREERDPEALFRKPIPENEEITPLKCDFCDKSFLNEDTLSAHIMTIHSKIIEGEKFPPKLKKDFKCNLCEKEYSNQNSLKVHVSTIHEKKGFKCYACDMTFPHNFSLYNHQQIVHKRKEFKCDFCGK